MLGYLRAARDLAANGGKGWGEDRNIDVIVKYTSAKREVIKKARPHVVDPNLELDASTLDSMQKLNADLGYLKYTEFLSADRLFTLSLPRPRAERARAALRRARPGWGSISSARANSRDGRRHGSAQ